MEDITVFLLSMLIGAACTIIVLCIIFFIIMVTGVHYKPRSKGIYALSRCHRKNKNKRKDKQDELIFPRR